jgi:hypothetical protein
MCLVYYYAKADPRKWQVLTSNDAGKMPIKNEKEIALEVMA